MAAWAWSTKRGTASIRCASRSRRFRWPIRAARSVQAGVRNLAGIVHPNLATLYELFAFDGTWFFTMELVDGRHFLEYVRGEAADRAQALGGRGEAGSHEDEPTMVRTGEQRAHPQAFGISLDTPEQYARLRSSLLQLAEAVGALHASGKLHRDIKPSNVLVTPEGRTALLDFGLTIAFGREGEEVRSISGTIPYMSPEQALAEPSPRHPTGNSSA